MATAKKFASKDHSHFDAFVSYILTHRNEDYVIYGIHERALSVWDLMLLFNEDGCPTLEDKPKPFFVEVCRASCSASSQSASTSSYSGDAIPSGVCPQEANFLLAYATVPGKEANLTSKGAWFTTVSITDIFSVLHTCTALVNYQLMIKIKLQ